MNINLKQEAATSVSSKPATVIGAIFSNSPGMPRVFKSNFDYQLVRAMSTGAYGDGGAVGEVFFDGTADRGRRFRGLDCRLA
jgi:hypothetical protein